VNRPERPVIRKAPLVLLFLLVVVHPTWGYIDPGTGSMLFSALSGVAAAAYFAVRGLWVRVKSLWGSRSVSGTSVGRGHRLVIHSEGRQYWGLFAPVLEELDRRGIRALFATADPEDPGLAFASATVQTTFLGQGNAAYWSLNLLEADLCLSTTPGLEVYHWKRSPRVGRYVHLLHAPNDATLYRLFGLDYYDAVLLSGDHQSADLRALESLRKLPAKHLVTVGSPYLDSLRSRVAAMEAQVGPPEGLTILVSPSWGPSSLLRRFGLALLGPLVQSGHRVIVRPHPQSRISEAPVLEGLRSALAGTSVEWDDDRENLRSLVRADVMISDYSGILFDYLFLRGRPVFYTQAGFDIRPYDAHHLGGRTWTFETLRKVGRELREEDLPALGRLAEAIFRRRSLVVRDEADRVRREAWAHPGESARRVVDTLEAWLGQT